MAAGDMAGLEPARRSDARPSKPPHQPEEAPHARAFESFGRSIGEGATGSDEKAVGPGDPGAEFGYARAQ
jgi:hypothetical protein